MSSPLKEHTMNLETITEAIQKANQAHGCDESRHIMSQAKIQIIIYTLQNLFTKAREKLINFLSFFFFG